MLLAHAHVGPRPEPVAFDGIAELGWDFFEAIPPDTLASGHAHNLPAFRVGVTAARQAQDVLVEPDRESPAPLRAVAVEPVTACPLAKRRARSFCILLSKCSWKPQREWRSLLTK